MEERDFSNLLSSGKNRKKERKEKKQLKKIVKRAFSSHKKVEDVIKKEFAVKKEKAKKKDKKKKNKSLNSEFKSFEEQAKETRMKRLEEELENDEKEIRRLAKKLGYNKRKTKSMPEIFAKEGMEGLWEVCEDEKRAKLASNEKADLAKISTQDLEMDEINLAEEDEGVVKAPPKKVRKLDTSQVEKLLGDLEDDLAALDRSDEEDYGEDLDEEYFEEEDDMDDNEEYVDLKGDDDDDVMEFVDENDLPEDDELDKDDFDDFEAEEESNIVEDIYGRKVDSKTGKIIDGIDSSKAKEKLKELENQSELTGEMRFQLTKSIRSILNRLNEGTLVQSIKTLTDLFTQNSRNDVKQILFDVFSKAILTPFALTDRLLIEYSAFISLTHQLISTEISAYLLEKFTLDYLKQLSEANEEKSNPLKNVTIFFAHLYNFKVIKSNYLIDIMNRLKATENAYGFNLLADILTYGGQSLRKRDSGALSTFLTKLQESLMGLPKDIKEDTRIQFLIEDFLAIKGNKLAKFTEKFDSSFLEHYYKVTKGLTKKNDKTSELGFTVDDVIHAEERGRWWVVGSAFNRISLDRPDAGAVADNVDDSLSKKFDKGLIKLAEKLKLKTEIRKTLFCTVMSATNVIDAFEKLLKLTKSDHQGREVIYILFVCTMNEKVYNPFYAALLERFCSYKKTYKITTQFAIWDKIKEIQDLKMKQRHNLAFLVADLIREDTVGLAVLKTVNFALMDPVIITFLKRLFFRLLVKSKDSELDTIFRPVVESPKLELLSQGLQLFFEVSLKPEEDFAESEELPLFEKRLTVVRSQWGRSI